MSTWIKLLPLELDGIKESEFIPPNYDQQKGDTVVGEMSEFVKRLFTLAQILDKEGDQSMLELKYCADKDRKRELEAKINQCKEKSQCVKIIAWICTKDELGLWHENVGFRTGFKVVTFKADDTPPFLRLLGGWSGE